MAQQSAQKQEAYRFFVDGKLYESPQQFITGAELRAFAGLDSKVRIFLGDHHAKNEADRQIHNTSSVDLAEPGEEKFYTLAAPTMDIY